jgi:hypothetical protein
VYRDNIHPTVEGQKIMERALEDAVLHNLESTSLK